MNTAPNYQYASWRTPQFGARHDRDVNAVMNLTNFAVSHPVATCGA